MLRHKGLAAVQCLSFLAVVSLIAFGPRAAFGDRPPANDAPIGVTADLPSPVDLEGGFCPAVAPDDSSRDEAAQKPRFRTCRCSCGAPCLTDADCDGAPCTAGITCC